MVTVNLRPEFSHTRLTASLSIEAAVVNLRSFFV
jgi:hypothetical protein